MKKATLLFVSSVFVFALSLNSCKSNAEKVEDAQEDVIDAKENELEAEKELHEAKTDSVSDYERLKAETKVIVATNKTRIAEFEVKLKQETTQNKAKLQKRIDALEAKNDELEKDIDSFSASTKEKWQTFKARVKKSTDDIEKDIEEYKDEHNY